MKSILVMMTTIMISYNCDGSNDDDNIGIGYDYLCCCQGDNDNRIRERTGRLSDRNICCPVQLNVTTMMSEMWSVI